MKNKFYRIVASAATIVMILSLTLSVGAQTLEYSVTKNSGTRGEVCTTLNGTRAEDYYTSGYGYSELSALDSGAVFSKLRTLMTETHTYKSSYADSKNYADETDCEQGGDGITLLYTSVSVHFSDFIGSGSIGWNREHVWPKSLGGFENSGAGADLHHIRPDDVTTNAKRGNLKYGNAKNGNEVKGSTLVSGALGGYSAGAYFEPLDNVKGDVARICLYVWVRYGAEYSKCSEITNVFESIDVLLEWCAADPVDTWEMGRNEVVAEIQGNRNVFIDYPEYAWLVFGRDLPENMTTPSGMAMLKEETTLEETILEETTAEITASVTEAETTAEVITETASEATTQAAITVTEPADEQGCGGYSAYAIFALIPICFAVFKKKE